MSDDVSTRLADHVRRLRAARGHTQAQLARVAGVPRATLAHLESGAGNPTLAVLLRVAAALQVSLEELVAPPRAACRHYPRASLPERRRGEVRLRGLLPDPLPGVALERMELPAGARMTGSPHMPGTREYLTCEAGALQLVVQGQRFDLAPGDVVVFRGDQPHSYRNPGGRPAVGYSVVLLAGAAPEAPPP
jgi:transcriptional regulator with XRE-family HTH domain